MISASSITGLVRNCWHRSCTRERAVASSGASIVNRMALPMVTSATSCVAERGQRSLDGGALGIGDAGSQPDLDQHGEPHAVMVARHRVRPRPPGVRTARPASRRRIGPRGARRSRRSGPGWRRPPRAAAVAVVAACPSPWPRASPAPAACRTPAASSRARTRPRARSATSRASGPRRPGRARRRAGRARTWCRRRRSRAPRRGSAAARYTASDRARACSARTPPSSETTSSNPMFSSWSPVAALVEGVNIGAGRASASRRPAGTRSPCTVPVARYSFHAEPARCPRTMHSTGSISQRRTSIIRPASCSSRASGGSAATSVEMRWFGATSRSCSNQKALIAVSTRPLPGTGSSITTSKADKRSDATMRRRSSPDGEEVPHLAPVHVAQRAHPRSSSASKTAPVLRRARSRLKASSSCAPDSGTRPSFSSSVRNEIPSLHARMATSCTTR